MQSTLTFQLPEEQNECDLAHAAHKLAAAIFDHDQWLRARIKYTEEKDFKSGIEELEAARENLRECASGLWEMIEQ